MARIKLYRSKVWLTRKYVTEKLTEQQIADLCNTSQVTINKWLHTYGLKRGVLKK